MLSQHVHGHQGHTRSPGPAAAAAARPAVSLQLSAVRPNQPTPGGEGPPGNAPALDTRQSDTYLPVQEHLQGQPPNQQLNASMKGTVAGNAPAVVHNPRPAHNDSFTSRTRQEHTTCNATVCSLHDAGHVRTCGTNSARLHMANDLDQICLWAASLPTMLSRLHHTPACLLGQTSQGMSTGHRCLKKPVDLPHSCCTNPLRRVAAHNTATTFTLADHTPPARIGHHAYSRLHAKAHRLSALWSSAASFQAQPSNAVCRWAHKHPLHNPAVC